MTVIELTGRVPKFERHHRMQLTLDVAGLSVEEMAEQMDKNRNTIGNWLHGRTNPDTANLREWARITGVDFRWLATGEEPGGGPGRGKGLLGADTDNGHTTGGTVKRLRRRQPEGYGVHPQYTDNDLERAA